MVAESYPLSIDNSASLDSPNRTDLYTKGRLYSGIQSLVVEEAVVARQRPSAEAVAVAMQPLHQVAVAERIAARRLHMTPGSGPWSPSRRIPSIDSSASYRNPNRIDRCTSDRRYRAGLRQTRVVAAEEEAVAMQPLQPVEVVVVVGRSGPTALRDAVCTRHGALGHCGRRISVP